ncbi:MAG TPA: hypothetical protein VHL58_06505 [Thermoanaerobaculia bacterium]|nr:hypothetical protein [Thermoanaerobaculia bacterium]
MLRKLASLLLTLLSLAVTANASIVTLANGRTLKVLIVERQNEKVHLRLQNGTEIWLPADAVQSVSSDEVDEFHDKFLEQDVAAHQ